jgi:DNA-binding NarL/FixJ family response regulator
MPDFTVWTNQISADAVKKLVDKRIRVLLVDDHKIARQGLCSLLQFESDIEVVGEAENGRQAIDLARQRGPEVVIMDINMPVMNGIEATRIITKEMPRVKVVALSMHGTKDTSREILEAGATACLTKGGTMEELVEAVRACHATPA